MLLTSRARTCWTLVGIVILCQGYSLQGIRKDGSLDKDALKKYYFEGEFDKVLEVLEIYRKEKILKPKEDRIFTYKYLGVIYAAKPETREKAESYMYQMLKLDPGADLSDMYISESIETIFLNVRERYVRLKVKESPPKKAPEPEDDDSKKIGKWVWWTAGGLAVTGVVAAFVLMSGEDEPAAQDTVALAPIVLGF
ncbi:hypothetical protein ACFL5V_00705 [Fibrobacterota bacterium]